MARDRVQLKISSNRASLVMTKRLNATAVMWQILSTFC